MGRVDGLEEGQSAIRSARTQERLCAARVSLVDEEVRGLVRRAVHVVDPVLLERARVAVHEAVFV